MVGRRISSLLRRFGRWWLAALHGPGYDCQCLIFGLLNLKDLDVEEANPRARIPEVLDDLVFRSM